MLPYLLECKTTLDTSLPLLQSSIFRKISVWNMFNSAQLRELNRMDKEGRAMQ